MWNENFINTINVLDFLISLQNLQENTAQTDKQELEQHFNDKLNTLLGEIHSHLEEQDHKLNIIMKKLEDQENDRR